MFGRQESAELVDLTSESGDDQQPIVVLDDSIVNHNPEPEVIDLSDDTGNHDNQSNLTDPTSTSTSGAKRKLTSRPPESKRRPPPPPRPPASPETSLKCPICMESFKAIKTRGSKVVVTRCGHLFCDPCLKKAFQENGRKCPKCRKAVIRGATAVIEVFDVC